MTESAVRVSPHLDEIHELLVSGWSPERVRAYLVSRYGEGADVPSAWSIRRYRQREVPASAVLPQSMIRRALGDVHYRVDTLKLLDEVIWAQEHRVGVLWRQEKDSGNRHPALADEFRMLVDTVEKRHKIAVELGVERPQRGARLERSQKEVMEIPAENVEEMLEILRQERDQGGQ